MTTAADYYFYGNACKFTGKTEVLHGATFYFYEVLEGHRAGQEIASQNAPKCESSEVRSL